MNQDRLLMMSCCRYQTGRYPHSSVVIVIGNCSPTSQFNRASWQYILLQRSHLEAEDETRPRGNKRIRIQPDSDTSNSDSDLWPSTETFGGNQVRPVENFNVQGAYDFNVFKLEEATTRYSTRYSLFHLLTGHGRLLVSSSRVVYQCLVWLVRLLD